MGLSCALGQGVKACLLALSAGKVNTFELDLPGFNEPVRMPYYRIGDGAELFDPGRFDRLIPEVALEAIREAQLSTSEIERLLIFVGSSAFSVSKSEAQYRDLFQKEGDVSFALPLVGFQHIADTLKASLGIYGDTYAFNTACTAAANAVMSATRMIQLGWIKHALVVGVELANVTTLAGFSGLQLVARELKPFDLNRAGIVLGEGIGAVVLSAADGDEGITVCAGATNCDTHSVTTANPDGSTIEALQREVMRQASVDDAQISAIKAHGTASPMNDLSEAAGMHRVFKSLPPVYALKPYLGHTLGACGVNELILFSSSLRQGFLPATPGFETRDPQLDVSPVQNRSHAGAGHYLLNYFGFGGNNTALLIRNQP